MIKLAKSHPYLSVSFILAITNILDITSLSWWFVLLPIWWWIPPVVMVVITITSIIVLEEYLKWRQ